MDKAPPYLPQDVTFQFILDKIDYVEKDPLNQKGKVSLIHFLKEFGTFALSCGRRSGHTSLAKKIANHFEDSIMFTQNLRLAKMQFEEEFRQKRVFTFNIKDSTFSGMDWKDKIIVVDMAYFISGCLLTKIYQAHPKFVILLG